MYNRYNPQYKASSDGCFAVAGVTYTRSNPTKPVLKQNLHVFHVARASLPGCLTNKHLCGTAEMSSVIFQELLLPVVLLQSATTVHTASPQIMFWEEILTINKNHLSRSEQQNSLL